jgi:hypothetical protein
MGAVLSRSGRQAPTEKNRRTQSTGNLRNYKGHGERETLRRSPSERLQKDAAKLRGVANDGVIRLAPLVRIPIVAYEGIQMYDSVFTNEFVVPS